MKSLLIVVVLCLLGLTMGSRSDYERMMRDFRQMYTSQKDMRNNIQNMADKECPDIFKITLLDDLNQEEKHLQLNLVTINDPKQTEAKLGAYYLFGEHSREVISSELSQFFLAQICKGYAKQDQQIMKMLKEYTVYIVYDANPLGRKKVDEGDSCNRQNENGVDLNRNYDAGWEQNDQATSDQTYSGPKPFSEKQTVAFKTQILEKYKIDLFLTVHSGAFGFYTPHAYDFTMGEKNKDNLNQINNKMNDYFCRCDHGCAGKLVGYLCPGTCLDYAYDHSNVINSFAWEIHDEATIEKMMNLFPVSKQTSNRMSSFLQLREVSRLNLKSGVSHEMRLKSRRRETGDASCFQYFNPWSKKQLNWSLIHFSKALFSLMDFTKETYKSKAG